MASAEKVVRSFDWEAYGTDVIEGRIPVCRWTRLGVERHYKDLEAARSKGYWFSDAHAQHALESFLFLRHSKGTWSGKQFELAPWQQFWIAIAFGWMRDDGTRRFREVWIEIPRKNGKSTMLSGIGLYLFLFDGEGGPEVYTAATKLDQARLTHAEAIRMVQSSPALRRRIGIRRDELFNPSPGKADKFLPLGRDSKSMDGLNPHGAILDEVHAHPDRGIYDVIKSGVGSRKQWMIWQITTAGHDLSSFGYSQHQYAEQVLNGVFEADDFLPIIYTVDHIDRWQEPEEWTKANPNLGISVYRDNLAAAAASARKKPSEQPEFKTKLLNIWLTGGESWIPVDEWMACASPVPITAFKGEECWIGMDLAQKSDFAALSIVFKRGQHYYTYFRYYYHQEGAEKPANQHILRWASEGYITLTPGNATDFEAIRHDLKQLAQDYQVKEIPFDPYFSPYFAKTLMEDGLPMVEIAQRASGYTPPVIEIENLVLERQLHHDGNPVTSWMISCVLMLTSKFNGAKKPSKVRDEDKIDGPVAMIMSMGRALARETIDISAMIG